MVARATPRPAELRREWVAGLNAGLPLGPLYGEPLEDIRVDNPSDEIHSIERYLGHESVASRVGARLAA